MSNNALTFIFLVFSLQLSANNLDKDKAVISKIPINQILSQQTTFDSTKVSTYLDEIALKKDKRNYKTEIIEAFKIAKTLGFQDGIAKSFFLIAEAFFDEKNYEKAIEHYQKAQGIYNKLNNKQRDADCSFNIAYSYDLWQKPDLAMENYKNSLKKYEKINDLNALANIYTNMGIISDYIGDYSNAMKFYIKSYEIDRTLNNPDEFALHLNNIGQVFNSIKIYNKAIEYLNKSVKLSKEKGDDSTLSYAYVGLNNVYLNTDSIKLAKEYIDKAIKLQHQIKEGDYFLLSISYTDRGRVLIRQKNYEEAEVWIKKGYNIAQREDLSYCIMYSSAYLVKLYNSQKLFKQAEKTAIKALELKKATNMVPIRIILLTQLKETYAQQGLFAKAYQIQEDIHELNRINTYESHVNNITELSANLDINQERKINEIKVTKQKEALMIKIEKQKIVIFFSILLLTSLTLLSLNNIKNHNNLKKVNQDLILKNKEIEEHRKEIDKQSKDLANLNEYKDVIFTIISHDLRKPLSHLTSILELIENNLIDENELAKLVPKISNNVRDTTQVLDSLLIWAKSQLKGFNLKITTKNLHHFIDERLETLRHFAKEKNITILNETDKNRVVAIDVLLTNIIIRNLVLNAIKYSNDYQQIIISSQEEKGCITVNITDQGVGIKEEQLQSLFDGQIASTLGTRKEKGTGLGLFFCKELVLKSGGNIFINSTIGKGTTVSFTIPNYS